MLLLLWASVWLAAGGAAALERLRVKYEWRDVDFEFPDPLARQRLIQSGAFVPGNPFPVDVDVWNGPSKSLVFVTLPRLLPGTPVTLATVSKPNKHTPLSPLLAPFPDWGWQRDDDCANIISVFRVQVDSCGRLWVLDNGAVDIFTSVRRICTPKILVFNPLNGKLLFKYVFPDHALKPVSLPVTIAVDSDNCHASFAYVADVTEFGLIVYDQRRNKSWRVNSNLFYPFPLYGTFEIAGDHFDLMDGVLGLALGPRRPDGDRILYFHSLASAHECHVSSAVLKNEDNFPNGTNKVPREFKAFPQPRSGQVAAQGMDRQGVMFFNILPDLTLNCWSSKTPYGTANIVQLDKDQQQLQFASGLKVVSGHRGSEEVWLLTSRLQRLLAGTFKPGEVNFRVLQAQVPDLVRGTACEPRSASLTFPHRPGGYGSLLFQ